MFLLHTANIEKRFTKLICLSSIWKRHLLYGYRKECVIREKCFIQESFADRYILINLEANSSWLLRVGPALKDKVIFYL